MLRTMHAHFRTFQNYSALSYRRPRTDLLRFTLRHKFVPGCTYGRLEEFMKRIHCKVFAVLALLSRFGHWSAACRRSHRLQQGPLPAVSSTIRPAASLERPSHSSARRAARRSTASTNDSGDFVIPNIPRDTYLVRVTMDGFKTVERPNVDVSPGQRVVVPTMTITVGALNETVTVTGEAPMIQSQTGERSFTVSAEAIQELPMNSRNWSAFTALTPGVIGQTRMGNVGQQNNNVMLDGVAIMDTGNNGTMLQTNVDAIGEIRILTQGYQAEFGRASGMQITAITKSGTNQYPRIVLRPRAEFGLELEHVGPHQERPAEAGVQAARLWLHARWSHRQTRR